MENMTKNLVIIISGPPCTGKTTVGKRLAETFNLPFINKDEIKELLFERLGWSDRSWSKLLSLVSYDLLFYFTESRLRAGNSLIVENIDYPSLYNTVNLLLSKLEK